LLSPFKDLFMRAFPVLLALLAGALCSGVRVGGSTTTTSLQLLPEPIAHRPSIEERLVRESTAQGLPPHIALNLAWEESRFQEHIVSRTRDYGVMQLNLRYFPTAPQMTTDQNIAAGVALLTKYWRQSHDERLAKTAYRHGPKVLRGLSPRAL
jgi:soluble lytic murein transglycosylase-like protein